MLVTAPKDPLFLVKSESTEKLRRIRQIRVLVFSDKNIVKVALGGSEKGRQTSVHSRKMFEIQRWNFVNVTSLSSKALQRIALPSKNLRAAESPLFTAPFEPKGDQLIGLHEIRLTVHFDDGATHEHVHRWVE